MPEIFSGLVDLEVFINDDENCGKHADGIEPSSLEALRWCVSFSFIPKRGNIFIF